jgi:hypothetical protein
LYSFTAIKGRTKFNINQYVMKNASVISVIFLFVMAGCNGNKQSTEDVITVDVTTTSYPKKELILQNFMDVEYVALETNDDFINQGFVLAIGKETILVRSRNSDGDIFVYDRTGKALRKINRKGQGGEEYTNFLGITLDEDNGEMFVNDLYNRRLLVYDLYGKFKRSFKHKEGAGSLFYTDIFNYDRDNLICYDQYNEEIAFVLVSKQDGSITKEIKIPFKEKKAAIAIRVDEASGMTNSVSPGPCRTIIPFNGNWILIELSSDTVYQFLPDYSLHPFIVRTPSIQSMDPGVFLILRLLSDRYYFMETIKNVFDWNTREGFPKTFMMYDRQEKALCNYTIYNGDFSNKKELYMSVTRPVNHEIESWYPLEAYQLVESYKKGELKGKLKEIAATLDEESNPVIMLIKHKK